jgi:hypothetical protein
MKRLIMPLLAFTLTAATGLAQDKTTQDKTTQPVVNQDVKPAPLQKFFRLDLVVRETEGGKVVNSRSYFMTVASPSHERSDIRTNSQVPVQMSADSWTRMGISTNFDCSDVREAPGGLSLTVSANINSIFEGPSSDESHRPIVRSNDWHSTVLLPIKKPTIVFSSDDVSSKRQMQVEITATPIG